MTSQSILWLSFLFYALSGQTSIKCSELNLRFDHLTTEDGLSHSKVNSIIQDSRGYTWIGTFDGGPGRYEPDSGRFTYFWHDPDEPASISNDGVYSIVEDRNGDLWLITHSGANLFDRGKRQLIHYIHDHNEPDSISRNDCKVTYRDRSDRIWISFEFPVLDFVSSYDNQYAYMLENFDSEWHELGSKRTFSLTDLNAGEYVLRAKGSHNVGYWNAKGASLRLIVNPPYWETLWFRALAFAMIIVSAVVFFWIRAKRNARLKEIVEKRTAELLAANRELEAFAYSVSHDLRAPLRSISGFGEVLLEEYRDRLGPQGVDYVQRIRRATRRMSKLIDSLLELSRIAQRELVRSAVDVTELANSIVAELRHSNPGRKVDFVAQPGLRVKADPDLLRIVLENLLGNAWKFTEMTATPRVELGRAPSGDRGAFFVRDNGVGFDMTYAENLFVPFHRLHSGNEFEGSGIGLATVKRIINRHGGDVWAEGDRNNGATFYFKI